MDKVSNFGFKPKTALKPGTNTSTSNLALYKPKIISGNLSRQNTMPIDKKSEPFLEEDGFTDLALNVEGRYLYTSRMLLSMCSPVFGRMLSSQGSVELLKSRGEDNDTLTITDDKGKQELQLPGKQFENVHELLYVIHPAYQRKVTGKYNCLFKVHVTKPLVSAFDKGL